MVNAKHTPGPWKYSDMEILNHFAISQEDGAPYTHNSSDVGSAFYMASCQPKAVAEANARIMAAAPELLEALESALENSYNGGIVDPTDFPGSWKSEARKAIAKAKGTES